MTLIPYNSTSEKDTHLIAKQFVHQNVLTHSCRLILLAGEVGAGKSVFVRQALRELGVKEVITSPTFTLVNEYDLIDIKQQHKIIPQAYHIDLYRIENDAVFFSLEIDSYLSDGILFIEWAQRFPYSYYPLPHYLLDFTIMSEEKRQISIHYQENHHV